MDVVHFTELLDRIHPEAQARELARDGQAYKKLQASDWLLSILFAGAD
jgi:hypothetical protein